MSEVRVHVRLGTLRLDFQGDQAFYEGHVEELVAAAAASGVRPGPAGVRPVRIAVSSTPAAAIESSSSASAASATPSGVQPFGDASSSASGGADGPSPTTGTPAAYKPASPEFGRYLRRLGAEADAPDRHVLAFAFYLWNYERLETFALPELAGCLAAIGRELPPDVDALMEDLTDKRRLLESAGPGRWRLAKRGENFVKTRLLTI